MERAGHARLYSLPSDSTSARPRQDLTDVGHCLALGQAALDSPHDLLLCSPWLTYRHADLLIQG